VTGTSWPVLQDEDVRVTQDEEDSDDWSKVKAYHCERATR